ncbi:hypothetical protein ASD40_17885 [Paenibacillus sp. Root444D2]|nr:hypothetical protein ASD40_17885 [Paenibacillus sp. Root444D2]
MRQKMLILFLLLIAVPLGIQGFVTYRDFSSTLEQKTMDYAVRIIHQINQSLEQNLEENMQNLSLLPLYNEDVRALLEKYDDPGNRLAVPSIEERGRMYRHIVATNFYKTEIRGIQVIANNGFIFTSMDPYIVKPFIDYNQETWWPQVKEADGKWVAIAQHKPNYLLESTSERYVSLAKLIRDPSSTQVIGMIKLDYRLEVFEQIMSGYQVAEIGRVVVVNRNNELYYEQNADNTDFPTYRVLEQLPNENTNRRMDIDGKPYLILSEDSRLLQLKVVSMIPLELLLQKSVELRNYTIGIGLVCLFAAGLLALFFSYRFSQPLILLKNKMRLMQHGKLNQSLIVSSNDEIGHLIQGFNRMTEEINNLIQEVYVLGLKEREAEIAALLSRINPHFIYNTLESINMMAIRHKAYDVSDMVSALGSLLRYSVDKHDRMVMLGDELESIRSYVKIQQIRYGDRLSVIIDAETELLGLAIPKLLLQPLVENAIYHGLDSLEHGGTIWIMAAQFDNKLLLTVSDNGKGLTDSDIERLRKSLKPPKESLFEQGVLSGRGLALRNINLRMILMYGEEHTLDIDGTPDCGASFTLTIPI